MTAAQESVDLPSTKKPRTIRGQWTVVRGRFCGQWSVDHVNTPPYTHNHNTLKVINPRGWHEFEATLSIVQLN